MYTTHLIIIYTLIYKYISRYNIYLYIHIHIYILNPGMKVELMPGISVEGFNMRNEFNSPRR